MTTYSDHLWFRACYRVACLVRSLCEEKGSSDTRLFEDMLLPDRYTKIGRSVNARDNYRREHVVPRKVVADECSRMLRSGATDEEVAQYISTHICIIEISREEQERLDRKAQLNLRTRMPDAWTSGENIFARLDAAGIIWIPLDTGDFVHPALKSRNQ